MLRLKIHRGWVLFIMLLTVTSLSFAQGTTKLTGTVTDANGAFLPYVSVTAKQSGSAKVSVGITDAKGYYEITIPQCDSLHVTYTYTGFVEKSFILHSQQGSLKNDVVMTEDVKMLDELVVNGHTMIAGKDKSMYFPTKAQRKSANTGQRLLYNLMIPEINVDRKTGSATTRDKRSITQCINGVQASATEIHNLHPDDIIRVDYYSSPSGKFAMYDAVIDFVVKKHDYGGYVDLKTETTMLTPEGNYSVNAKYTHKNWEYQVIAGTGFINDNKSGTETTETVNLEEPFVKTSFNRSHKEKSQNAYGLVSLKYSTKNMDFTIRPGLSWNRTPKLYDTDSIHYSQNAFPDGLSTTRAHSRGVSPYVNSELNWTIGKKNYLYIGTNLSYSYSRYNRNYQEMSFNSSPLTTRTNEDSYDLWLSLYYTRIIPKGSITLGFVPQVESYNDRYHGSTENSQELKNTSYFWRICGRYSFSDRLSARVYLDMRYYKSVVNNVKEKKLLFQPRLDVTYKTSESGRLDFNLQSGYTVPPISWKSSLSQKVNYYEIIRGNENIEHFVIYQPSISYTQSLSFVDFNIALMGYSSPKSIQDDYYVENNMLIHSYKTGGSLDGYYFMATPTFYLLNRNMQLSLAMTYGRTKTNDVFRKKLNIYGYNFNWLYMIKEFTLSAYYAPKSTSVSMTRSGYSYDAPTYGLSASWSHNNWYFSVDANNFFETRRYTETLLNALCYTRRSNAVNRSYYPSISINVSYNINFGHKKVNRSNIDVDKKVKSGILKPTE